MDEIDVLRDAVSGLFARAGVQFSYLFGSRASGRAQPGSDTDIAISFSPGVAEDERADRFLRLGSELELLLRGEVDLVDLDRAPFRLAGRIATERVILTGLDEPARVQFETEVVPRYLDARYHFDRFDRLALEAMATGQHIVATQGLPAPQTFAEVFHVLARSGWLPDALAMTFADIARFRNLLVHGYAEVDDDRVIVILQERLDDLAAFRRHLTAAVVQGR